MVVHSRKIEKVVRESAPIVVKVEEEGQFVVLCGNKLNILCVLEDLEDAMPIKLYEVLTREEGVNNGKEKLDDVDVKDLTSCWSHAIRRLLTV